MNKNAKKQFNNGDVLIYKRRASGKACLSITVGWVGTYNNGSVTDSKKDYPIPLVGICDISSCFDKIG